MSYLHLPSVNLADFNKGVISLWFRFSQDSVKNAKAYGQSYARPDFGDGALGPAIFRATIPLVTFGRKVMADCYGTIAHVWTQQAGGATLTATTFDSVFKGEAPCEPSHLGLEVQNNGNVTLKMIFQTATRAQVQGLRTEATNVYWAQPTPTGPYQSYDEVRDISYILTELPEQFEIIPKFNVDIDTWHHLLVSFDFSTSVDVMAFAGSLGSEEEILNATVRSYCKFWYAFDDENKNGQDNMGYGWVPQNANGIVPVTAKTAAFDYNPYDIPVDAVGNPITTGELYAPEYHWTATPIPMNSGPVGLPASAEYVDTISHSERRARGIHSGKPWERSNA